MTNRSLIVDIQIEIAASPERVFAALTAGIAYWWGTQHLENPDASDLVFETRVGGRLFERWDASTDRQGSLLATVVAIKKPELLVLNGQFGMRQKVMFGEVEIKLQPNGHNTLLTACHRAFGVFGTGEDDLDYERGWFDLMGRLKFFVEEGAGDGVRHDPSLHMDSDIADI